MRKLNLMFLAAAMLVALASSAFAIEFRPSGEINIGFFGSNTMLGDLHNFQNHNTIAQNIGPNDFDPDIYVYVNLNYTPRRYQFKMEYGLDLDFIASEQLSGRIGFKSTTRTFAQATGQNGWDNAFYVGSLYIDWQVPQTPVSIRLGRWTQGITNFTGTTQLLSTDIPHDGVRISAKINDHVRINALWWRRGDDRENTVKEYKYDYLDQFFLEAPLTFDGISANVWATYIRDYGFGAFGPDNQYSVDWIVAWYGTWDPVDTTYAFPRGSLWRSSHAWGVGGGISVSKFSPWVLAFDFAYSSLKPRGVQFNIDPDDPTYDIGTFQGRDMHDVFNRRGWYLSGRVSYHTAYGTPSLYAWYTTGDDSDLTNGSERPLTADPSNSGIASLFKSDYFSDLKITPPDNRYFTMAGTWGLSAQWSKISLIDNLFHSIALSYIRGTNDPVMAHYQDVYNEPVGNDYLSLHDPLARPFFYMTKNDSAIALELSNSYHIYKELVLAFDLFYIWQDFDPQTWSWVAYPGADYESSPQNLIPRNTSGREMEFCNVWGIGLSFNYKF